jgi:hypothetical protein
LLCFGRGGRRRGALGHLGARNWRSRNVRLDRLMGCIFATQADRGHYDCTYRQEHPSLHLYYGKDRVAPRSTLLIHEGVDGFDPFRITVDSRAR